MPSSRCSGGTCCQAINKDGSKCKRAAKYSFQLDKKNFVMSLLNVDSVGASYCGYHIASELAVMVSSGLDNGLISWEFSVLKDPKVGLQTAKNFIDALKDALTQGSVMKFVIPAVSFSTLLLAMMNGVQQPSTFIPNLLLSFGYHCAARICSRVARYFRSRAQRSTKGSQGRASKKLASSGRRRMKMRKGKKRMAKA